MLTVSWLLLLALSHTRRWNTRSVRDGWHTITAKAYDKYGNAAEATVKVYVSNRK
ncbi:MAG: hypothetical protein QXT84_07130 [Candidatus Bathyarchaeia archaeon]